MTRSSLHHTLRALSTAIRVLPKSLAVSQSNRNYHYSICFKSTAAAAAADSYRPFLDVSCTLIMWHVGRWLMAVNQLESVAEVCWLAENSSDRCTLTSARTCKNAVHRFSLPAACEQKTMRDTREGRDEAQTIWYGPIPAVKLSPALIIMTSLATRCTFTTTPVDRSGQRFFK